MIIHMLTSDICIHRIYIYIDRWMDGWMDGCVPRGTYNKVNKGVEPMPMPVPRLSLITA